MVTPKPKPKPKPRLRAKKSRLEEFIRNQAEINKFVLDVLERDNNMMAAINEKLIILHNSIQDIQNNNMYGANN